MRITKGILPAWNRILDIFFPPICIGCSKPIKEQGKFLCEKCFDLIKINNSFFCPVCMARMPDLKKICHPDSKYILSAASFYAYPIPALIHNFKYKPRLDDLKNILGAILISYFKNLPVDLADFEATFVPLYFWKEKERGFNQSEVLAKIFSNYFSIPLTTVLKRIKNTDSQAKQKSHSGREENVRDCFKPIDPEKIKGKNFILIDDVSTSGATISEAVKTLKENGARKIVALVVAKA